MRFIITNDDGIDAPGLAVLTRILAPMGCTVVAAPAQPQSGVGHQVTDKAPIRVEALEKNRYGISGTPADCVRIGTTYLAPDATWVIAGINHGGNLGADIYISGTVAAAREAALLGYRAIALSQYVAKGRPVDWNVTGRRAAPVLRMLLDQKPVPGCFWNVNLPHPRTDALHPDVVFCAADTSPLQVRYRRDGDRFLFDGNYHERPRQPGRDVAVCLNGRIAITCIPLDITLSGKTPSGEAGVQET